MIWNVSNPYKQSYSNAAVESMFSTFRRFEMENYGFEMLQCKSLATFNRVIYWLMEHQNRSSIIDQAGFHIIKSKIV